MTFAGTGFSEKVNSYDAGVEAAEAARQQSGITDGCDMAFLFTTSRHTPAQFADGVRSVIGHARIFIGGCGVGFITNDRLGYDGYQSAVALMKSNTLTIEPFLQRDINNNEYASGFELGKQIEASEFAGERNLLIFYDAVNRTSGKLQMTLGTTFVQGLYDGIPDLPVTAGGGLTGDMQFGKSFQWWNDEILNCSAFALSFSGTARMHTTIMHGCMPASAYHTITKADNTVILEIDNEPALQFVQRLIGEQSGLTFEDFGFFLTIGVNHGKPYDPFETGKYSNCMCVNVDKKRGGLYMVENNLQEGTQIQLMRRSLDFQYIYDATETLLQEIEDQGRKPVMAFYIDCAGRASYYLGSDKEEAAEVQLALKGKVPLLGFYSGVELAKVGDRIQPLDWTGVLAIISE
jgi:hypothetical protein